LLIFLQTKIDEARWILRPHPSGWCCIPEEGVLNSAHE